MRDTEKFWQEVQQVMFESGSLEYDDFTDIGIACGLLVHEPYAPEGKHKDMDIEGDVDADDMIYVCVPPPTAPTPSGAGEEEGRA